MKRYFLLMLVIFSSSLLLLAEEKPVREYWAFKDKYTLKTLQLDSDSNFTWFYRSCTGHTSLKGVYTNSGDTIFLRDRSKCICLLKKDGKLYTYYVQDKKCSEFEALSKVPKKEYRRLIAKHRPKIDKKDPETDKVNKTATDAAPFLEFFLRMFGVKTKAG